MTHPAPTPEDLAKIAGSLSEAEPMGADYWRMHAERGGPLKPLGRPCWDCAVVLGMYEPLSTDLARQPDAVVQAVCGNWFCHNHGDRACAGNIENVRRVRNYLETNR